jgi:hypothetical protein
MNDIPEVHGNPEEDYYWGKKKIFYFDLIERVLWTFAQAAAGAGIDLLASGEITWRAVAYAGLAAVLKALVAVNIGDKDSAATLPSPPDHA